MNEGMAGTGAVLALWNDVTPEQDAEYNEWHANEHVPERLSVPGMLWGRRYRRVDGAAAPHYLTVYGMRDAKVLESEAYRLLLARPTPMSARMRPHLCNLSRWVCEVREARGLLASPALAVWTFDAEAAARRRERECAPCDDGLLLARRSPDAAPLPWLTGGQILAVEGNWLLAVAAAGGRVASPRVVADAVVYSALPIGPALAHP